MKKALGLILLAGVLLLCSCGNTETDGQGEEFSVYYLNRDETKILAQTVRVQAKDRNGQILELIQALSATPENVTLKAVAGTAFTIQNYRVDEEQLTIDVDDKYKELPRTTEVLMRASIVRTMTQVKGISHVLMTVNGAGLADSAGNAIGPMSADAFIDNAGAEINAYEKVTLRLYFANEAGDRLVEVDKKGVVYNSNISMEKLVVENLIKGPGQGAEDAYPTVNPDTKVVSVTVKDGICYVNFDETFLTQIYNVTADVTIYSIANSLVELPNVNKVQISINGETNKVFRETFNLANLYERNLDLVQTGEN